MTAPHEAVPESRNRLPLLAGGGLAVVLLLFVVTKVLGGGGGGGDVDTSSRPAGAASTVTTTAAAAAPAAAPAEQAPVETFEVFNTKNPFMPLRSSTPPSAASTSGPAPAVTPSPVVATPVAITSPNPAAAAPAVTTVVAPSTGSTGGQATAPVQSKRVALLDVFVEGDRVVANVRVNDTVSKVAAGDTFATNFKVVSLDTAERCGRFLFGDDQFRLCRGEEVLK